MLHRLQRERRTVTARFALLFLLPAVALLVGAAQARGAELTTTFVGGNSFAGNTFDLEVLKPRGVVVESLLVNLDNSGASANIEIWTRPETSVGFESDPSGWTSRGTAAVTSAGTGIPTPVPVSFSLPRGEYGMLVGVTDYPSVSMQYTNGANTYENADLRLVTGSGLGNPIFGGGVFTPRTWNGSIIYSTPSCEFAKKKLKKAKKKVKKAKQGLADANASGNQAKIAKAERKLDRKKKKVKKAKRTKKRACS